MDEQYKRNYAQLTPRGGYDPPATVPDDSPEAFEPAYGYDLGMLPQLGAPIDRAPAQIDIKGDYADLRFGLAKYKGYSFPLPPAVTKKICKILGAAAVAHLKSQEDSEGE